MNNDPGIAVMGVHWGLCVIPSTVFVVSRFIVRYRFPETFNYGSDILIALSYVCQVLNSVGNTVMYKNGLFDNQRSITTVNMQDTQRILQIGYITSLDYFLCLFAVKGAIVCVYYSLIPKTSQKHRIALHSLSVFIGLSFVVVFMLNLLGCTPIENNWSIDPTKYCFSYQLDFVMWPSAMLHIATDLGIVLIPFPLLLHLKVSTKAKIALAGVFSIGFLSIVATILRLVFVLTTSNNIPQVSIWSAIELATGIIVACFPAFRALLMRRKTESSRASRKSSGWGSSGSHSHSNSRSFPKVYRDDPSGTAGTELNALPGQNKGGITTSIRGKVPFAGGRRLSSKSEGPGWRDNDSEEKMIDGREDLIVTTDISYEVSRARGVPTAY